MKGILLAGGNGRRLDPLTNVTNKHLLPVYDRPMVYYPLQTLKNAGIRDILIVTGKEYAGGFLKLLGSGRDYGCRFNYEVQDEAGGIAQALGLAQDFVDAESCAVILGDNIYEDDFAQTISHFEGQNGARIFLKEVTDAQRFGVAEFDPQNPKKIIHIEEKPAQPKTNFAVTGFYLYDRHVFDVVKGLKPSGRGELEITDVNNYYIQKGQMEAHIVQGDWTDAGTFESLYRANRVARKIALTKAGVTEDEMLRMQED